MRADVTGNRAYANAANQERALATRLRNHGYDVIRAAGSHGAFDLLASRHGHSWAIECKRYRASITPLAWHTLWLVCQRHDWTPVIAAHDGMWQLAGDRPAGQPIDDWLIPIDLLAHTTQH